MFTKQGDGTPLPKDRISVRNGRLSVFNLRKSDHGTYECVVENEVTALVARTTLLIESKRPNGFTT